MFAGVVLMLLVGGLGDDSFYARERAQGRLEAAVKTEADAAVVRAAAASHPDPEVRLRCRLALTHYERSIYLSVVIPEGLRMVDLLFLGYSEEWRVANMLPQGEDVRCFVRTLLAEGESPGKVEEWLRDAKARSTAIPRLVLPASYPSW